jgi:hypothetical protein
LCAYIAAIVCSYSDTVEGAYHAADADSILSALPRANRSAIIEPFKYPDVSPIRCAERAAYLEPFSTAVVCPICAAQQRSLSSSDRAAVGDAVSRTFGVTDADTVISAESCTDPFKAYFCTDNAAYIRGGFPNP